MEDWQGRQVYAEYDSFSVEPESDWYRLRLGEYQGNAGDSLSWHNNKAFTTLDQDRDGFSGLVTGLTCWRYLLVCISIIRFSIGFHLDNQGPRQYYI